MQHQDDFARLDAPPSMPTVPQYVHAGQWTLAAFAADADACVVHAGLQTSVFGTWRVKSVDLDKVHCTYASK